MEEDSIEIISISHLLDLSSPLSGAFLLSCSPSLPSPLKKPKTLWNPSPNWRSLSPLTHPVLLIGTVELPSHQESCNNHCFSFSDGSSKVCCYLLDLQDLSFIANIIHVLAWNFLPSKDKKDGILEIIKWCLPSSLSPSLSSEPSPNPAPFSSGPLGFHRCTALGALKSISPIFSVPCGNPGANGDSIGFLAEIITCACSLCRNFDAKDSAWEQNSHSFVKSRVVYFLSTAAKWRPALNKLTGKLIAVSGLKKKMVFVGEKESYEMLVTTEMSTVSLHRLPLGVLPISKEIYGGDKVYTGVITGVYVQGMVVELDEKVWLLVTNAKTAPQHYIRVGAILSVRNFHLLHLKFSWVRINLLGTCARTSIDVKAFTLPDNRYYVRTESQSILVKFIESLTLSAKFWVLLLVSCFRRKFANVFSDKEILGLKNQKGLAHMYAMRYLGAHFFQPQKGIFHEFCKHGQCIHESESNMMSLKLVIPFSNFISKCESMWVSMISKTNCDVETSERINYGKYFTSKGGMISCQCSIRRIISSEDLGFILVGTLKISSSSGRLQLADATGTIDVIVPDLLSNVNGQIIYEVREYKLIMEGCSMHLDSMEFQPAEALSCSNIFQKFPLKKVLHNFTVYVLFYLKDSTCLDVPFLHPSCKSGNDYFSVTGEITHLLFVTHKFPVTGNLEDPNMSCNSSLFAEAIVLPYKLLLLQNGDSNLPGNVLISQMHEPSPDDDNQEKPNKIWAEMLEALETHNRTEPVYSKNVSEDSKIVLSKLRCVLTFRTTNHGRILLPGYLRGTESIASKTITNKRQDQKVLLEFKSDRFFMYQSLQLGGYYILKRSGGGLCHIVNDVINHGKIHINSQCILWRMSFDFGEIMRQKDSSQGQSSGVSSPRVSEAYVEDAPSNDIIFQQPFSQMHRNSDVCCHLLSESMISLNAANEADRVSLIRTFPTLGEILSVSSCRQLMMADLASTLNAGDPQKNNMPRGNLVSLHGNIEHVYMHDYESKSYVSSKHFHCANIDQRMTDNIVIHVSDEHQYHAVQIYGNMRKYAYPVGLGPGANASFHRVLMTCNSGGCPRLVLLPVSFIVINSISESGHQYSKRGTAYQNVPCESFDMVASRLASQLTNCMNSNLFRCTCRVVSVHTLVLELSTHVSPKLSRKQLGFLGYNIPLAGFMLDDGSCLCSCWADAARAERLLRLRETAQKPFFKSRSIKKSGTSSSEDTVGSHLQKMLKKHSRVIIKNSRSGPDLSTNGFTFTAVAEEVFSILDEKLIRLIMLNACGGSAFSIAGKIMDANALQLLGDVPAESCFEIQTIPNVWITEVGCLNSLEEARSILHELTN